jgi:hypothetical protein
VIVNVLKSGSLKSGISSEIPLAASLEEKNAAFEDRVEEAKPCR